MHNETILVFIIEKFGFLLRNNFLRDLFFQEFTVSFSQYHWMYLPQRFHFCYFSFSSIPCYSFSFFVFRHWSVWLACFHRLDMLPNFSSSTFSLWQVFHFTVTNFILISFVKFWNAFDVFSCFVYFVPQYAVTWLSCCIVLLQMGCFLIWERW